MKQLSVGKKTEGYYINNINKNNFNRYINDISKYSPLTVEEEIKYFELIKNGDNNAINIIYKHNLLFVVSVAKKYIPYLKNNNIELDDLISEGNIGLYESILSFDITKGFKFITYAVWKIRFHIMYYINANSRIFKLPTQATTELIKIEKEILRLEQINEHIVYHDDIDDKSIKKVWNTMKFLKGNDVSLDKIIDNQSQCTLLDFLESEEDTKYTKEHNLLIINDLLKDIPITPRKYIIDRYGLETGIPLSFRQINNKYNQHSIEGIRVIIERYKAKIKNNYKYIDEILIKKTNHNIKIIKEINNGKKYETVYLI